MPNIFRKKWFYIVSGIILIIILIIIFSGGEPKPEYITATAEKAELIQEVSVTGTVKPAESVELAFEKTGRVAAVYATVGKEVRKGQILASLSSGDLYAQLQQAQASLESTRALMKNYESALTAAQASLDETKQGTRPEEIIIAQTSLSTATKDLADSKINLVNVENKADADLQNKLETTAFSLSDSITTGLTAIITLTDIQSTYFVDYTQESNIVAGAKATAVLNLLGHTNGGRLSNSTISSLSGGARALVTQAENEPTEANVQAATIAVKNSLTSIRTALSIIPLTNVSTANITSINTQKSYVDASISTTSTNENAINVQKATNQSSVSTAEASINDYKNALQAAKDNLALKLAGSTPQQLAAAQAQADLAQANVDSQAAQIKYAQANVNNYAAQLGKNSIRSPLTGIVTAVEAKVGEIMAANTIVFKVMSDANYEIEAHVAEVDIANLKLSDTALVTLDAYGNDKEFTATVVEIDPAETVIDGVPTYKTVLQFNTEDDSIKSGMTANVDITTNRIENALSVPQRAVLRSNGDKIVRVLQENEIDYEEKIVQTGLRGSEGNIEILSGLNEGDIVIVSIKNGK
jgi:HlyD family secretion protein